MDVFRDVGVTYINNLQPYSTISALRTNIVTYEHKLIVNNNTVFGDLIYNPTLGIRQNRLRVQGIKTDDWDGTISSLGYLLMFSNVSEWQPNTDYLRGDIVKYKNKYLLLKKLIANSINNIQGVYLSPFLYNIVDIILFGSVINPQVPILVFFDVFFKKFIRYSQIWREVVIIYI